MVENKRNNGIYFSIYLMTPTTLVLYSLYKHIYILKDNQTQSTSELISIHINNERMNLYVCNSWDCFMKRKCIWRFFVFSKQKSFSFLHINEQTNRVQTDTMMDEFELLVELLKNFRLWEKTMVVHSQI